MTRKNTTTTAPIAADVAKAETDAAEVKLAGSYADAIKAIKAGMAADTRKLKTLDAARDALLEVRCSIVRNTAHAMTFPESHAKAGKTAGQPSQSVIAESLGMNRLSFAPYFKAASEFYAKFPELKTEPGRATTDPERDHVASFWKAEALRAKARRAAAAAKADKAPAGDADKADNGDGESAGAGAGAGTDGRTSDVTIDTVMAAMALLAAALETFTSSQGFTVEQGVTLTESLDTASALVHAATVK